MSSVTRTSVRWCLYDKYWCLEFVCGTVTFVGLDLWVENHTRRVFPPPSCRRFPVAPSFLCARTVIGDFHRGGVGTLLVPLSQQSMREGRRSYTTPPEPSRRRTTPDLSNPTFFDEGPRRGHRGRRLALTHDPLPRKVRRDNGGRRVRGPSIMRIRGR